MSQSCVSLFAFFVPTPKISLIPWLVARSNGTCPAGEVEVRSAPASTSSWATSWKSLLAAACKAVGISPYSHLWWRSALANSSCKVSGRLLEAAPYSAPSAFTLLALTSHLPRNRSFTVSLWPRLAASSNAVAPQSMIPGSLRRTLTSARAARSSATTSAWPWREVWRMAVMSS